MCRYEITSLIVKEMELEAVRSPSMRRAQAHIFRSRPAINEQQIRSGTPRPADAAFKSPLDYSRPEIAGGRDGSALSRKISPRMWKSFISCVAATCLTV